MTIKTGAVARDLVVAAEQLSRNQEDLTESDRELIKFADEFLRPLINMARADIPSDLPTDEALMDQALAGWPAQYATDHQRAVEGRKHSPDDFSFNPLKGRDD